MQKLWAGVDEAGRGPWAGAVFAAAVILDPKRPIAGLADSKKYGFSRHKGYGTAEHQRALNRFGPCAEHRSSFAPIRRALAGAL